MASSEFIAALTSSRTISDVERTLQSYNQSTEKSTEKRIEELLDHKEWTPQLNDCINLIFFRERIHYNGMCGFLLSLTSKIDSICQSFFNTTYQGDIVNSLGDAKKTFNDTCANYPKELLIPKNIELMVALIHQLPKEHQTKGIPEVVKFIINADIASYPKALNQIDSILATVQKEDFLPLLKMINTLNGLSIEFFLEHLSSLSDKSQLITEIANSPFCSELVAGITSQNDLFDQLFQRKFDQDIAPFKLSGGWTNQHYQVTTEGKRIKVLLFQILSLNTFRKIIFDCLPLQKNNCHVNWSTFIAEKFPPNREENYPLYPTTLTTKDNQLLVTFNPYCQTIDHSETLIMFAEELKKNPNITRFEPYAYQPGNKLAINQVILLITLFQQTLYKINDTTPLLSESLGTFLGFILTMNTPYDHPVGTLFPQNFFEELRTSLGKNTCLGSVAQGLANYFQTPRVINFFEKKVEVDSWEKYIQISPHLISEKIQGKGEIGIEIGKRQFSGILPEEASDHDYCYAHQLYCYLDDFGEYWLETIRSTKSRFLLNELKLLVGLAKIIESSEDRKSTMPALIQWKSFLNYSDPTIQCAIDEIAQLTSSLRLKLLNLAPIDPFFTFCSYKNIPNERKEEVMESLYQEFPDATDRANAHRYLEFYEALFTRGIINCCDALVRTTDNELVKRILSIELIKKNFLEHFIEVIFHKKFMEKLAKLHPPSEEENQEWYPFYCIATETHLQFVYNPHFPIKKIDEELMSLAKYWSPQIEEASVEIYGQPAIDQGGPLRQFLHLLFSQITKNTTKMKFERHTEGFLPKAKSQELSDSEASHYQALGYLLGKVMSLENPEQRYHIGEIFSPGLFRAILTIGRKSASTSLDALSTSEDHLLDIYDSLLGKIKKRKMSTTHIFDSLSRVKETNSWDEVKDKEEISEAFTLAAETLYDAQINNLLNEGISKNFVPLKNLIKKEFVEQYVKATLLPLLKMVKGLEDSLPIVIKDPLYRNEFTQFTTLQSLGNFFNGDELSVQIQGVLSKEDVINSLRLSDDTRFHHKEKSAEFQNWLIEWINRKETTLDKLRGLVQYITGGKTLDPTDKIFIAVSEVLSPISALRGRTCLLTLEVPIGMTKEVFFDRLEHHAEYPEEFNEG